YFVYTIGSGGSVVNVRDTGTDAGADTLTVYGTDQADALLLRANAAGTNAFVASLHGTPPTAVERVNYDAAVENLVVNAQGGDDTVALDDNLAATTVNGGAGNDRFQVGQIFKSPRDAAAG